MLRSFHSLCPLLESGHDKLTAQRLSLVLLTLACEDLASRKVDLNRALSDVITERSGEVSSFKAFLRSEAFTGKKTKAEAESSDIARMEDIEIIADLLYEFTAHFFIRGSGKGQNLLELSLPHWTVKVEMSPSPRKPRRSNQTAAESSIDMMEYLATHLRQVCTEVARSFRIYHSDSDQSVRRPVLTSVATLFATYMCFRRSILLRSSSPDSILARFINHGPADTARSDGSHRSALLLPQQVLVMAEGIEQHVLGVLGRDRATAALSKADAMTPEDFELVMAQLIGIPIPTGWGQSVGLALSACQLDVDSYLLEVTGPGLVRSPRVVPTAQQRLDTRSVSRLNRTGGSGRYTRALTSADDTAYAVTKIASSSRPLVARNSAKFMPETEIKDSLRLLNGEALSLKANLDHLIKLREAAALIKAAGIVPEGFKDDRNAVLNNTIAICKRLEADKVTAASEVRTGLHDRSLFCICFVCLTLC